MIRQRTTERTTRKRNAVFDAFKRTKNRVMLEASDSYEKFLHELELMEEYRADTVKVLNSVADEIDKRRRKTNIAKLVGASVGVVATPVAATGIALIPFTGGASAVVAGVTAGIGGALMGLWTLTSASAHFVGKLLENVDLAKVQKVVDRDVEQCKKMKQQWG